MNRKLVIEKLLKEGFKGDTLSRLDDKSIFTLAKTVLKETVMIKAASPTASADIAAAKKAGKTIETYESNVCPVCGMKDCKCKDKKHGDVNEKWEGDVKVKKTGEHSDKTVDELKKELKALKEKSKKYQDEDKKVPKKIIDQEAELKFAIRAKQGWKDKIKENTEVEEWVLDLAESKYSSFTSKKDIMSIISEKMETFQPMPENKARKGHNGVPEFMTYDSIAAGGTETKPAPSPNQPDVIPSAPPKENPDKQKNPYQPGPGTNPKPKAGPIQKKKN